MTDTLLPRAWLMRALYLALSAGIVFWQLLPISTVPPGWAGPELFLALTFAFAARRPDYLPIALVAVLALGMDLLLQRPPGLWAAITVLGVETIRNRASALRDLTFLSEWAAVTSTLVVMTLTYRIILTVFVVDQAPLGLSLMQLVSTVLVYPLVALVSHALLGVRKRVPGDIEPVRGGRI
ncbi:rod shape-determining protein MreD [Roseovarius tibetensis]|uniref:rod shape-determining protein MreD n=1 Tax=Roseovarius tibetensis TaxID=2685897 RepID=UPI003D7F47EE